MSRSRVLFVGPGPGVDDASTASVAVFHRLLADGWDARYVTAGGELGDLVGRHAPDLAVAWGAAATLLVRHAAPTLSVVFMAGICRQGQRHVVSGRVADAVSLMHGVRSGRLVPRVLDREERRAVLACDLLVALTPETLEQFEYFFPTAIGKVHRHAVSPAAWIADSAAAERSRARPWEDRDIDVLCVADEWWHPEKNYAAVCGVARQLRTRRVHVVGEVHRPAPGATHHGGIPDARHVLELMGRARAFVCPALFDSSPGLLIGGALLGANVVATPNCGSVDICHPDLRCATPAVPVLADAVHRALDHPYPHGLDGYLDRGSYRHFAALLEAMAAPRPGEVARERSS